MKKILVFTGAGVSKESGIETFRDSAESLWNNYRIEDVATAEAWRKDKELVLDFYNQRRKQLKEVEPNLAHDLIAKLEEKYQVIVVTQNVDNLHERAGSTNVIHLHGELTKVRSTLNPNLVYDWYGDCNLGDKCEKGSQLRPHIVWFNEMLDEKNIDDAVSAAEDCDFCVIVGTSLQVSPANLIPFYTKQGVPVYYVDPGDLGTIEYDIPQFKLADFHHVKEVATIGMQKIYNKLNK